MKYYEDHRPMIETNERGTFLSHSLDSSTSEEVKLQRQKSFRYKRDNSPVPVVEPRLRMLIS